MPKLVNRVEASVEPGDHPYLNGAWTPNYEEWDADDMDVIGEIPADIDGVYVRNTENPAHGVIGKYHPFDGDGMLHMMRFKDGKATYRNRFIRTRGFEAEQEARRPLWIGFTGKPGAEERPGSGCHGHIKDASSTDVVVHGGEILTSFWQCGEGYRLSPDNLETLGLAPWAPIDGVSAHTKVDLQTGELLFFNYSRHAPYMHYGVVGADGRMKHYIPVELPGPRLPHDMAFSKNYSVLNDFPMFWPQEMLDQGRFVPWFHKDMKSRFAVVPRYGNPEDIQWFEADPTFVLHYTNCYEDGDEVVLEGYFQDDPFPPPLPDMPKQYGLMAAGIDIHSFKPHLHRWRFNLKTGETHEERICDADHVEFGTINPKWAGKKNRYVYSALGEKGWFLFAGLVKHDLETGTYETVTFGDQRFGSETPFIPRKGATDEDDGYLVSFITDMAEDRSECVILDARNITAGPVCRIMLPHRICSGTHAVWAEAAEFETAESAA